MLDSDNQVVEIGALVLHPRISQLRCSLTAFPAYKLSEIVNLSIREVPSSGLARGSVRIIKAPDLWLVLKLVRSTLIVDTEKLGGTLAQLPTWRRLMVRCSWRFDLGYFGSEAFWQTRTQGLQEFL